MNEINKVLKHNIEQTKLAPLGSNQSTHEVDSLKRRDSIISRETFNQQNKENVGQTANSKKHPIDNLQGYWMKMKNKRGSRTRNSQYLNSVNSINPGMFSSVMYI